MEDQAKFVILQGCKLSRDLESNLTTLANQPQISTTETSLWNSCLGVGELRKRGDGGQSGPSDKKTRGDNELGCVPAAHQQEANRLSNDDGGDWRGCGGSHELGERESQAAIEGERECAKDRRSSKRERE